MTGSTRRRVVFALALIATASGLLGCLPPTPPPSGESVPAITEFRTKPGAVRLGPEPISLDYARPVAAPASRFRVYVTNASLDIIAAVKRAADDIGLEILEVSAIENAIEIRHTGLARSYVDCGSLAVTGGDPVAAFTPTLEFRLKAAPSRIVRREMRLDTRSVIQQTDEGSGVRRVSLDTIYAVTRTVETFDPIEGRAVDAETVTFEVEGRGEFRSGMRCHPTGVLERVLLSKL